MIQLINQEVTEENHSIEPIGDLIRIQKALFMYRDIYCTLDECGAIWQHYSWEQCASWIFIPDEIEAIVPYIESTNNFNTYKEWSKYNDDED